MKRGKGGVPGCPTPHPQVPAETRRRMRELSEKRRAATPKRMPEAGGMPKGGGLPPPKPTGPRLELRVPRRWNKGGDVDPRTTRRNRRAM